MLIPGWQRFLGLLIYILPWSDALPFGKNLFTEFPWLNWLTLPAIPLLIIEQTIPFGSLLLFFFLFLVVVRNPKIPYFLRFNALQALLVDITVVILSYAFQIVFKPFGPSLIVRTLSNTVMVSILAIMIFAIVECIQGKEPDLPGISEAVRIQLY